MKENKKWLVRIFPKFKNSKFEIYVEVDAQEEYYARQIAINEFEKSIEKNPSIMDELKKNGIEINELCAGDAVCLNE